LRKGAGGEKNARKKGEGEVRPRWLRSKKKVPKKGVLQRKGARPFHSKNVVQRGGRKRKKYSRQPPRKGGQENRVITTRKNRVKKKAPC